MLLPVKLFEREAFCPLATYGTQALRHGELYDNSLILIACAMSKTSPLTRIVTSPAALVTCGLSNSGMREIFTDDPDEGWRDWS